MPSAWICAKHLMLFCMTSVSLNCEDGDLIDRPFSGYGIGWMFTGQQLHIQVENSDERCSSGVDIGTETV